MLIVPENELQDVTKRKIEEPKGNQKHVACGRQSRVKFMFQVLKGNLNLDVSQEFGHIRVKVKNHSQKPGQQDQQDQGPFQIMEARIMEVQFSVNHALDEDPAPSDQAESRGNVPENQPPTTGRFGGESHGRDEKPEVPEKEEVDTRMEQEEEIPETSVSMVKFPQGKNIQDRSSQFLPETAGAFLPPGGPFINGTPAIEFPPQGQRSPDIPGYSHPRDDDAE